MGELQKADLDLTKPVSLEEIYAAKEARRKRLAALPIDEKVRIMEELQETGRALIEARKTLPRRRET